jgi:hypothetical protein
MIEGQGMNERVRMNDRGRMTERGRRNDRGTRNDIGMNVRGRRNERVRMNDRGWMNERGRRNDRGTRNDIGVEALRDNSKCGCTLHVNPPTACYCKNAPVRPCPLTNTHAYSYEVPTPPYWGE